MSGDWEMGSRVTLSTRAFMLLSGLSQGLPQPPSTQATPGLTRSEIRSVKYALLALL